LNLIYTSQINSVIIFNFDFLKNKPKNLLKGQNFVYRVNTIKDMLIYYY